MQESARMTALTFPTPATDAAMDDDRRDAAVPGRRDTDRELVHHVRAVDTGAQIFRRWAEMLTTLVCFGFTLGMIYTKFGAMEKVIVDMRTDIRESNQKYVSLDKQTDRNTLELAQARKELDEIKREAAELRGVVDTMRSMREAYVYNAAARGVKPSVPP